MNVQKHHFAMNKLRYILIPALVFILSASVLRAESYDRVERRNLWNEGRNVTGLMRDTTTISYVELYYSSEQGDYRNFSDASTLSRKGAVAKSITHFERVSMIGSFSYDHTDGEEMCGSMFISPNGYPLDILEFTPGDKTLQSYEFMGGITSNVNDRLSIGVKGEFKAQNYAKFKDLRHYNYRMELSIMPSVAYKFGEATLGASYIFARNSETIRAQEIGSTAAAYYAFLDKGLMSGAYETWGGTGVHLDESGIDGFPVRENFNGVAVQAEWRDIYGELEYLSGNGEVGEKQTFWFDFPSQRYTARLGYRSMNGDKLHIWRVEAQYYTLTNNESVLGSVTENGVTTTVKYGSNEIFSTKQLSIEPSYELMFLNGGDLCVGVDYYRSFGRSTLMYPYVDELTTTKYQLYVGGMVPFKSFEFRGRICFSTGDVNDDSYVVADDVDAGDKPSHLEDYYNVKNEYLTATSLATSLAVRYNHPKAYFVELGASYTQAFDLEYIDGDSRWSYKLSIGYKF